MRKYTVYFEIFGKKMKYVTEAHNRTDAIEQVKSKLNIVKVERIFDRSDVNPSDNAIFDFLKGFKK